MPHNYSIEKIKDKKPEGLIIAGGEDRDISDLSGDIFKLGIPVLAIGYE